ncbi:MAG: NAD(P)H-hydrate epimerase [Acidobacteria bacterium]|nr:NAD(P)H-hydrate epimerase [Acidobacteriota bacterium]
MREIDRLAVDTTGPNLFQMMENAGRSLALQAIDLLGAEWRGAGVVVLAGAGGNGGGGVCAARHLANHGVAVRLVLADPDRLTGVAAQQRRVFASTPGREVRADALAGGGRPDVVIDALVGYGLREAPRGATADLIDWANASGAPILALDVPSGLDATTGEAPGLAVAARMTLTLALPKTGCVSPEVGELWLADLGIPVSVYNAAGIPYVDPFGARYRVRLQVR